MKTVVKSQYAAEKSNEVQEPHVIISIREPGRPYPELALNDHTKDVMFFQFDDIDRMLTPNDTFYHVLKDPKLFSSDQAERMVKFIRDSKADTVVVHCAAGISRSAAVAAALEKHYNGDDSRFFDPRKVAMQGKQYHPNRHVYRLMLEALNEGKD